jgi:large subunit ribosomal protein L20
MSYSSFIHGLKVAGVALDRSALSEMAQAAPEDFGRLVELAREQLATPAA